MSEKLDRREFLRWTAGSLAGLGLAPLLVPGRALGRTFGPVGAEGLPPRTVGLRSLGGDFVFDPAGLRLEPGGRLTWLNMGDFHTTTAFHPDNSGLLPGDVPRRIPEGAEPWHSGMLGLDAGTEFSHVFEVPGVYDYFCQPHYSFGMVGRVVVSPSGSAAPGARPASELNEASRAEMPAVEHVLGPAGRAFESTARINGVLLLRTHDEPTDGPVGRLVEEVTRDEELHGLLERAGEAGRARSSLERFAEAVRSGSGYETLVARADEAKAPLSAAADAARAGTGD